MANKFLITSLGSIGRRHLENLRKLHPTAEIGVLRLHTAINPAEFPEAADYQFAGVAEALAFGADAAIIASPASTHLEIARAFLAAKVPMLIEKPIAHSISGLKEFVDGAIASALPVAIGYNLRLLTSLGKARELILDGAIGEVYSARAEIGQYLPDWRPATRYQDNVSAQRKLGGGPLLELSHELDYLYWIFGLPETVTAFGGRFSKLDIDVEDLVELCLQYEKPRRLVNVHLDFIQRSAHRSCRFIGSEGTLIWDGIKDTIDIYRVSTGQWETLKFSVADRNQMYIDELSQFLGLISGAPTVLASPKDGYDVLAIVEAAMSSLVNNNSVKVNGYA